MWEGESLIIWMCPHGLGGLTGEPGQSWQGYAAWRQGYAAWKECFPEDQVPQFLSHRIQMKIKPGILAKSEGGDASLLSSFMQLDLENWLEEKAGALK